MADVTRGAVTSVGRVQTDNDDEWCNGPSEDGSRVCLSVCLLRETDAK